MGGILIKPDQLEKWRLEGKKAQTLLTMTPFNNKEAEMIEKAAKEQRIKIYCGLGLGFSFGLSLKRYFPESLITTDKMLYFMAMISVLLPGYVISTIYTNREVISQLNGIYENHKILLQLRQERDNSNS